MIAVTHLPQHATAPVGFQDGADLVGFVRDKTVRLARGPAVVKERATLGQAAVLGGIGHPPSVYGRAVKTDQIDRGVFALIGSEKRKSWPGAFAVPSAQAGPGALELCLLDRHVSSPFGWLCSFVNLIEP